MSIRRKSVYEELSKDSAGLSPKQSEVSDLRPVAREGAGKADLKEAVAEYGAQIEDLTAKLKESARAKNNLYFLPTPLFTIDTDYNVTYINLKGAALIGSEPKGCVGRKCYDIFQTPLCRTEACPSRKAMSQGKQFVGDAVVGKQNVLCSAGPIRGQDMSVVGAMETLFDVTAQKQLEAEMAATRRAAQEKATYNDSVLKSIRDIHAVVNTEGVLTYVNEAAEKALGLQKSELLGKRITDVVRLEKNGGLTLKALVEGIDLLGVEDTLVSQYRTIPVSLNATIVRDSAGKVSGLSIIARDVTAQKTALDRIMQVAGEARKGNLNARINLDQMGELAGIAGALNDTLDTFGEKATWYEAIIDAVPFPIHVTDVELKWTHMNEAFEALLVQEGRIRDRTSALGMPCCTASANICNTDKCGIRQLNKGARESFFDWCGMSCKQDTSYLLNQKGEKIGYVEVVTDLTGIIKARDYAREAVEHLAVNLDHLANGNLDFDLKLREADQYTKAEAENFARINANLEKVKSAVSDLITDVNLLSTAAVEGRLQTRANASRHQGDYRKIVEGLNATLDSVTAPLNTASVYMDRIGRGDIPSKITENYRGDYNAIKVSLNNSIDGLGGLVESNAVLQRLAANDTTTTVKGNYSGIYADVARAANSVRDRQIRIRETVSHIAEGDLSDLVEYRRVRRRSENDELIPAFIKMIEAIQHLGDDVNALSRAATEGNLQVRADVSRHQGDYARIVAGLNGTLDAVVQPLNEAMRISEAYSRGDLTARVGIRTSGDFDRFARTLDQTGVGLTATVKSIDSQVDALTAALEEATASVEEVMSATNTVASGATSISQNTETGAEGVKQTLKAMEDLAAAVAEISSKAEATSNLALKADEQSKKGQDLAVKAGNSMVHVTRASQEVATIIKDIKVQMEQIGKIVQLIQNIADQTNLLALNAAIEAARAGEAGRGFAVVATEVKALAQNSQTSAENISEMIGALQKKSENAVQAMDAATKEVASGTVQVDEALKAFKEIVVAVGNITDNIQHVASATEEQSATVEELTASITEVHQLIDRVARESQKSAAATDDVRTSMDQIGQVIDNVNKISQGVTTEMNRFKIAG